MLPSYIYSLVHIISRCFAPNSYLFESRARENDHPARSTSILYKNIADTCTSRTHTQTRTRTYMHKPLLIRCAVVPDKLSLPPLLFLSQTHTHTHTQAHTSTNAHMPTAVSAWPAAEQRKGFRATIPYSQLRRPDPATNPAHEG